MRIIAGAKRGMKLLSPRTDVSRPITDRVKESLFSVLYKYDLPGGKIAADLFCGVGSLGLEALSRGAEFVTFVEKDPKIIATLKKNIEKACFTGLPALKTLAGESPLGDTLLRLGTPYGGWKVIRADAFKIGAPVRLRESAIARLPKARPTEASGGWSLSVGQASAEALDEQKYDLVFVDPPYSTTRETKEGSPLSELLVLLSEQSAVGGIVVVRTERRTELLEQYGRFEVIERRQWGTMAVTILQRSSK